MTAIITNSRIYKLIRTLLILFIDAWPRSILGRWNAFLKRTYEDSLSRRLWIGLCSAANPVPASFYGRIMAKVREILVGLGLVIRTSLCYRLLMKLKAYYINITRGSLVFSQINKLKARQWLLLAFTIYLPLDYVFRTKVAWSIVASLWEELFIIIALFVIIWRISLKGNKDMVRETPLDSYILLFMAVGLVLMSIVNPHPHIALAGYRATVEYMIWFFLIVRLIEDDKDFKLVFYGIAALGILLGLHGIYQYIIAVPIPAGWVSRTEMGVRTRVFSLTGSPNILGSLMVLIAPMVASMIYYSKRLWAKLFFTAMTGAMCLCLLFTFSRGAWVGMVVAVVLFALFMDRRLLAIMGAGLASALIFLPSIASRLTYLFTSDYAEASAVGGRTLRWETGRLLLMENNPWLGFGLGRFGGAVAMNNKILEETEEFSYFYMDNYYLKTMVEMGYIGIAFFLLLLGALLVWGLRAVYQSGEKYQIGKDPLLRFVGNDKAMAVGILSGLSCVLAHCYFENIFEYPYIIPYFWGLAALLMYLGFFKLSNSRTCPGDSS